MGDTAYICTKKSQLCMWFIILFCCSEKDTEMQIRSLTDNSLIKKKKKKKKIIIPKSQIKVEKKKQIQSKIWWNN